MKRLTLFLVAVVLVFATAVYADGDGNGDESSWTGEVVDLACYVAKGAHGPDHSSCAKSCVKNGQPMGLLTEDGTLVLLAANHEDGDPYEALKDLAGGTAEVMGTLADRDGLKVLTVTSSKAGD